MVENENKQRKREIDTESTQVEHKETQRKRKRWSPFQNGCNTNGRQTKMRDKPSSQAQVQAHRHALNKSTGLATHIHTKQNMLPRHKHALYTNTQNTTHLMRLLVTVAVAYASSTDPVCSVALNVGATVGKSQE